MMGPSSMSLFLVVALAATLSGHTMAHTGGSSGQDTTTSNMTRVDSQCSLQRRQDLLDNRLNEVDNRMTERDARFNGLDTRLSAQLNGLDTRFSAQLNGLDTYQKEVNTWFNTTQSEVNSRFNRINNRLDGIEAVITDMKAFLESLMDIKPEQEVSTAQPDTRPQQDDSVTEKPQVYKGCQDVLAQGVNTSGVYTIHPDNIANSINVYCEQRLDGGGWTVFQARHDGSVNFFNDWNTYKAGFGNLTGEFWLGNTNIYLLSRRNDQQLKIVLTGPEGAVEYASYLHFSIGDELHNYRLKISRYTGSRPPGDSLIQHNGSAFSTKDQDATDNCATRFTGAWWFEKNCLNSNLNGQYGSSNGKGMIWNSWGGYKTSMMATKMMMRKYRYH